MLESKDLKENPVHMVIPVFLVYLVQPEALENVDDLVKTVFEDHPELLVSKVHLVSMDFPVKWERKVTRDHLARKVCADLKENMVLVVNLEKLDPAVFLVNLDLLDQKVHGDNKVSKDLLDLVDPMDHPALRVTLVHKVK